MLDELRLAAIAVRSHHESAGETVGDISTEVLAHDVQAQVDACRDPAGGEHIAGIDVEHIRNDLDRRVAFG